MSYDNSSLNSEKNHLEGEASIASTVTADRSWKQRYSITAHPSLPILLCSDGFNVLSMQLNELMQIPDLASNYLLSANKLLRGLVRTFKFEVSVCLSSF